MDHFHRADHFVISQHTSMANDVLPMSSYVGGKLVEMFPDLPGILGNWCKEGCGNYGLYYLYINKKIGLFQNMTSPRIGPNLAHISEAARRLKEYALANPDKLILLEAPNHRDPYFLIEHIMKSLPDNVEVWKP